MISAIDALNKLREGNRRFVSNEVGSATLANRVHRAGEAKPQHPFAIILACSDSRVPTELIFDCGIGDLFVIRVAGNVVAPPQLGSIEYAVKELGTRLVVVLGHSNCGAVSATLNEGAREECRRSPNLGAIVDRIYPAVETLLTTNSDKKDAELLAMAVRANVTASVDQLRRGSPIIEEMIATNDLQFIGAEYSIENGTVEFLGSP